MSRDPVIEELRRHRFEVDLGHFAEVCLDRVVDEQGSWLQIEIPSEGQAIMWAEDATEGVMVAMRRIVEAQAHRSPQTSHALPNRVRFAYDQMSNSIRATSDGAWALRQVDGVRMSAPGWRQFAADLALVLSPFSDLARVDDDHRTLAEHLGRVRAA